jgi:hypothetical protein
MPGEYRLVFSGLPEDFYVQEARIGRIDALRETIRVESSAAMALDIVVASGTATISGVVWDASRRTVAGARVVIAPADRPSRPELFRDTVANQEGRFSVAGLPPGDYRAFAWESIEPYGWFDPEILSRSRAQSKSVKLVPQAREIVEVDVLR